MHSLLAFTATVQVMPLGYEHISALQVKVVPQRRRTGPHFCTEYSTTSTVQERTMKGNKTQTNMCT
jgi:hypothetical protein